MRRGRWLLVAVGFVAVSVGWLAWRGMAARDELDAAKASIARLKPALVGHDQSTIERELANASLHADRARALTSDPVWRVAGWLPWIGATPHAVTVTASTVDAAVVEVLPKLSEAAQALNPQALRAGDQINLKPLAAAAPMLASADARLGELQADLSGLADGLVLSSVGAGVRSVDELLASTRSTVHEGSTAARVLPPMLGAAGVRRYLVVLQNNAEARGTGGLVGAFAVIEVANGRPSLVRLGSNSELKSAAKPAVDLGENFAKLFGNDPGLWSNTNLSAHFPHAARLQLELWRRQFGQSLDGVIATDPVAFGYLISVSGPLQVPGLGAISGAVLPDLTMRAIYAQFPLSAQERERNAYQQSVARVAIDAVLVARPRPAELVRALGKAASERRLLIYSAHADEQKLLADTSVGGAIDDAPGPFAAVVIDNEAGNKLDYYLDRRLDYVPADCAGGPATITVTLHNAAPAKGLPLYAAYRQDRGPTTTAAGRGGDGSTRVRVLIYGSVGANLTGATLAGGSVAPVSGKDGSGQGRPVYSVSVELASGQTRALVLSLVEQSNPATGPAPRAWVGPLVRAPKTTVQPQTCR